MNIKTILLPSLVLAIGASGSATASSHREAPGLSNDAAADITDVYTFKAAGSRAETHQVFIFNVSPGYIPQAGPNWYRFDDNVLYELHVDTTGDAVEDVTYQFRFTTKNNKEDAANKNVLAYLPKSLGGFDPDKGIYNGPLAQTYTVRKVTGGRRSSEGTQIKAGSTGDFNVAPPNVGPSTIGSASKGDTTKSYNDYKAVSDKAIVNADGGYKFFAGPRNDPFFVDLGAVFDAAQIRVLNTGSDLPRDSLKGVNVLTIAFEVPVADVVPNNAKPYFGVWATTSRPQAQIRRPIGKDDVVGGGWVQVSRLGNPLVNEAVIGYKDKDKFNYTQPKDDASNFASYVTDPQLGAVLNILYAPSVITALTETGRQDLVDVFVFGIKAGTTNVSRHPDASATGGDMIRVNRALDLGGGYVEGWPLNGRKLTDDIVKTTLTFLADCKVLTEYGDFDVSGIWSNHDVAKTTPAGAPYNCYLDDGVTADDDVAGGTAQLADFPYVGQPHGSYQ